VSARLRALLAGAAVAAMTTTDATAAGSVDVSVGGDRRPLAVRLGSSFEIRSIVANHGATPDEGLVAHLNILSVRPGTYVDPEDWSSARTRYLGAIPPGGRVSIRWRLQAVSAGSFAVYVAVVPADASQRPRVGPAVRVSVARRQTLDPGGVEMLALGIPLAVGLLTLGLRMRRRRPAPP
jgi:hypothetical protein